MYIKQLLKKMYKKMVHSYSSLANEKKRSFYCLTVVVFPNIKYYELLTDATKAADSTTHSIGSTAIFPYDM